jgi:hypothetical protein
MVSDAGYDARWSHGAVWIAWLWPPDQAPGCDLQSRKDFASSINLADVAYQEGNPHRLGGINITAADGSAALRSLSRARVMTLESGHQWARSSSARVSKSRLRVHIVAASLSNGLR